MGLPVVFSLFIIKKQVLPFTKAITFQKPASYRTLKWPNSALLQVPYNFETLRTAHFLALPVYILVSLVAL
jgi:hypothetical protein